VGIDWGVYGTPESFLIDKRGIVRHKHIGPISEADVPDLMTRIQQLKAES
jgi:cytochrome c biogenesis protein CcmG/thiol:disulfide interchange protein DsbE